MLLIKSIFERNKVFPHRLFCPFISKRRWNTIGWISKSTALAIMASPPVSKLPNCYFPNVHRKLPVTFNKPRPGKSSTTDPVIRCALDIFLFGVYQGLWIFSVHFFVSFKKKNLTNETHNNTRALSKLQHSTSIS